jgi:hypothetical protein
VRQDLSTERGRIRRETPDGLEVRVDYRWDEPRRLSHDLTAVGVRFTGRMQVAMLTALRDTADPVGFAERDQERTARTGWTSSSGDNSATLVSPFGNRLELELLES